MGHGLFRAKLAQESAVERRLGIEHLAFDEDLAGGLSSDNGREVSRSEHDAETASRECEACITRTDPVIAGCHEIAACAERCAPHDGDSERGRAPERFEQILEGTEALAQVRVAQAIDIAKIGACAKVLTAAVEDDRPGAAGERFV